MPVEEAGDAIVVTIASQTKWLSEIRLYVGEKPGSGISNYAKRETALDSLIPDDPEAAKLTTEAREAYTKAAAAVNAAMIKRTK